jgi:gentisate 1,2-dioxygenase
VPEANPLLQALEARMAAYHLRGQWQADPDRPHNVRKSATGVLQIEPAPAGVPHIWKWQEMQALLRSACDAMTESNTARRSLIFNNPALKRGTTQTLVAGFQIVPAGEIAWAHRHSINALRLAIQGGPGIFTVVDGRPLIMEPYDLILTPGWSWHDHHNESDHDAIWMDGLDVPFTLALNQSFYEELGEVAQERRREDSPYASLFRSADRKDAGNVQPYRYPWKETQQALRAQSREPVHPCHGRILDYVNPLNGGSVLPTINCRIQVLPPAFEGKPCRSTSSSIAFVIEGEGRSIFNDREFEWQQHDGLAITNWTWHRHVNRSKHEPAILFTLSDSPILSAFGFYREETEDRAALTPAAPAVKLSAAE